MHFIFLHIVECERRHSRCSPRLVLPDSLWVVGGVTVHTASFRHANSLSSDKIHFFLLLLESFVGAICM